MVSSRSPIKPFRSAILHARVVGAEMLRCPAARLMILASDFTASFPCTLGKSNVAVLYFKRHRYAPHAAAAKSYGLASCGVTPLHSAREISVCTSSCIFPCLMLELCKESFISRSSVRKGYK